MAKLSQQLATLKSQSRPSRTERLREKQRVDRERKRFAQLKTKAEKIQQEQFKDKVVTETYYVEIPHSENVNAYTRNKWFEKPDYVRARAIENVKKAGERVDTIEMTREKVIPFTIDEGENSYANVYSNLDPEIQQFFSTPTELKQQKSNRIAETTIKVEERLAKIQEERALAKQKYDERIRKNEEWFRSKSSSQREKYRERYKQNQNDYEDDYEEKLAELRGIEKGLNEGKGQLASNKDLSYDDIYSYASDLGSYEERREEARNEQREFERTRAKQIKDLEEQGYKPYVIQQFSKGNLEKLNVSYYNPKTQDWKKVTSFDVKSGSDVSKLEKSQLGRTQPINQTLDVFGKKISFSTSLQLYKTSKGDVVTQFGSTGLNENKILKDAQDKAYKEWQSDRSTKPFYTDLVFLEKPASQISQGSISTQKEYTVLTKEQYLNQKEKKLQILPKGVKDWWAKNRPKWYLNANPYSVFPLQIGIYPTSNESIDLTQKIENLQGKLDDKVTNINLDLAKKEKVAMKLSAVDEQYQQEFQLKFEDKYMKDIIYGETTFEKASAEFKDSKEAKLIERSYADTYGKEFEQARRLDLTRGEKAVAGLKLVGLGTAKTGLSLVKTPTSTALTVAGGYGLYKGLALIPPSVIYGGTAVYTGYSAYKIISPTSSPEEVGSGIIGVTVGTLTLGYGAYRYLRTPVVKTQIIRPDIKSYTKRAVGVEQATKTGFKSGGRLVTKETVAFGKQKLSQQVIEGRRTIVTSKFRVLSNKYFGTELKPLYQGVPYVDQAGYSVALKRLTKYGYTSSQAKSVLRYYQPKVITQTLQRGRVDIFTGSDLSKAYGKFEVYKEQPIFSVDKNLGIKTRGAKTIRDVYEVERAITGRFVTTVDKKVLSFDVLTENIRKTTSFVTKQGGVYNTLKQAGKTKTLFERKSIVNVGEIKQGAIPLDRTGQILKQIKYQDIENLYLQKQILPFRRSVTGGKGATRIIKAEVENYIEFDLDEITGISPRSPYAVSPAKIKKTPFAKTFGDQSIDEVKKIIKRDFTPQQNINKIIANVEKSASGQSQFYGKGLYERTEGGLSPSLKQGLSIDQIKVTKIKALILPKVDLGIDAVTKSALLSAQLPQLRSRTKQDYSLKTQLKQIENLKLETGIKQDLLLKQGQSLKQGQALKSALKQAQLQAPVILTPNLNIPGIPKFRPPTIKPFLLPNIQTKIRQARKRKSQIGSEYAYLPDFTSRALGLDPDVISGKQAEQRLKKILTGLEIRRGVVIK